MKLYPFMMRNLVCCIIALALATLVSCSNFQKDKKPPKTQTAAPTFPLQREAATEITNFFGGNCEYGYSYLIYPDSSKEYTAWFRASSSDYLTNSKNLTLVNAGCMALIAARYIEKNSPFSNIRIEILNPELQTFNFSSAQVQLASEKAIIYDSLLQIIKSKKYPLVASMLANAKFGLESGDSLKSISRFKFFDKKFGPVKSYDIRGFYYDTLNRGLKLKICGQTKRERASIPLTISFEVYPPDQIIRAYSFDY